MVESHDHSQPPSARTSLRDYNQWQVTAALKELGSATRAELRTHTGLSRATLGTLVDRLISQGTATEASDEELSRRSRGRPAQRIRLTSRAGIVIGMVFGHNEIWAASADLSGTVLQEQRLELPVDNSAATALDAAAELWGDLLVSSARGVSHAASVAVGLPCPIDAHTQRIVANNIFPGWVDIHPADELYRRTKHPTIIENDANLAALGEWRYGAGQGIADLIYVKASVGIGAGFIFNGVLYRGSSGTAGEIGHIQVDPDGPTCRCGNRGCLETSVSLPRVLDAINAAAGRPISAEELAPLILGRDIAARRIVADAGRRIGRPLADLCSVLNPKVIIVGGELGSAGTVLTEAIQESINRYAQPMIGEAIAARRGVLGARAEVLGAIALAIAGVPSPAK